MPSRKRRIHRSRRNNKPIIIVGILVIIIVVAVIAAVYVATAPPQYTLTIYTTGEGSVTPGNSTYASGTVVELTATSPANWTFYGWTGDASGKNNTNVTMTDNKVVTASFVENKNRVLLETSMGNITIQLREDMPITTQNFREIVKQGLYDGTIFHRVRANFVIQGGQLNSSWNTIPDEFGSNNRNVRGTIAMAKTDQPDSATSQFFINLVDNGAALSTFDSTYSVFGDVIEGMDVVDAISLVSVEENPYTGEISVPITDVVLIRATFLD